MMLLTAFFLSSLGISANASVVRGGTRQNNNKNNPTKKKNNKIRQLKGKGGGDIYSAAVQDYESPPAGLLPGDIISNCGIKLTDDLDCRGAFDCLTLNATEGDVTLDCDGHTIGNYDSDNNGIDLMGCNGNTITIKNCYVTGFEGCIVAGDDYLGCRDYNVVVENTAAVGCQERGMDFDNIGDVTLTQVVVTGNGDSGIGFGRDLSVINGHEGSSLSQDNIIFDEVFACGNSRDYQDFYDSRLVSADIKFSDNNSNNYTSLVYNDVTADTLLGALEPIATLACPLYAEASCVAANGPVISFIP